MVLRLSAWLVLFLVQARLIAAHRRTLHMRLGIAGAVLAALAVTTTYAAAFEFAAHGVAQDAPEAVSRLYSSLQLAALFGLFVAAGIVFRSRPEIHKRLMVLAMLAVVGPGAHRAVTLIVGHGSPHSHVVGDRECFWGSPWSTTGALEAHRIRYCSGAGSC